LTGDNATPLAKVQAVTRWLRKTHGYTTNLKRDLRIRDPLEDFLFHEEAGHCEYFASAAAVLLRQAGVPTRYINGFLGGEWNDLGGHVTIRDNRAHSWIEAYVGESGWIRVDATPVGSIPARMSRLRQVFDSVELFWSQWVIDYDASRQLAVARKLGKQIGWTSRAARNRTWAWERPDPQLLLGLLCVLTTGLTVWAALQRHRRARRGPPGAHRDRDREPIALLYKNTLDRLRDKGWTRAPSETPREFARRLQGADVPGATSLHLLTEHYGASRYGARSIDPAVVAQLGRDLGTLMS
jgi:hypothetical protein